MGPPGPDIPGEYAGGSVSALEAIAAATTAPDLGDVRVEKLGPETSAAWDHFATRCSEATFFHLAGWREVIERAFGHPTHYLLARSGHTVRGVLPLSQIKSRLFGNSLISSPFCVYGGIAASDEQARDALASAARKLAEQLQVSYLELRNLTEQQHDWPTKDLYVTFRKPIAANTDANLKAIPRKQRAMVRKGVQAGLQAEIDTGIDRVYAMYSESVRNLGTPVFPKRYFEILKEVFGRDCEVVTVSHQGTPVSAVMSFYFRDEVLPYYGGGTACARELKANDFMYWQVMCRAAERGCRLFDYGRSKVGTGSYSFKKNWGFKPQPLHYRYHLVRAGKVPNVSPTNPRYRLFIQAWKRLPLPISRALGPLLARNLG